MKEQERKEQEIMKLWKDLLTNKGPVGVNKRKFLGYILKIRGEDRGIFPEDAWISNFKKARGIEENVDDTLRRWIRGFCVMGIFQSGYPGSGLLLRENYKDLIEKRANELGVRVDENLTVITGEEENDEEDFDWEEMNIFYDYERTLGRSSFTRGARRYPPSESVDGPEWSS